MNGIFEERETMIDFQVMPPLSAEERRALKASIKQFGILSPITVDPDGNIVDGHYRSEIAAELNYPCPREVHSGTPEQLRSMAYSLNLDRRHLTSEQKRELVKASLTSDPQLSDREHARRTGVDHKTAAAVRDDLEVSGEIPQIADRQVQRKGTSYKQQPASKPKKAKPKPAPELVADQELTDKLKTEEPDLARREARRKFHKSLSPCWAFQEWDPEYVSTLVDDDDVITVDHLIENLISFRDRLKAARKTPLAPVKELRR